MLTTLASKGDAEVSNQNILQYFTPQSPRAVIDQQRFKRGKQGALLKDDKGNYQPEYLRQDELDYFKNRGNVTLFIHGYNVGYGQFGDVIRSDYHDATVPTTIHPMVVNGLPVKGTPVTHWPWGNSATTPVNYNSMTQIGLHFDPKIKATLYRDIAIIEKRFTPKQLPWASMFPSLNTTVTDMELASLKAEDIDKRNTLLNGTGMHNWLLNLEYALNVAAGFEGFNQWVTPQTAMQYQRLLAIAWQGDPVNPLDYIAMEKMAMATAPLVAQVIEQIHEYDASIQINVIAHSAGNALLTYTAELLGQAGKANIVSNAFMWEAAIPNTVFSNDPKADTSLRQHWQTVNAYKAIDNIHVMYSEHDNVLGPIPELDGMVDSQLDAKYHTPGGGEGFAMEAYLLDALDCLGIPNAIQSPYNVSQMLGYTLDDVLFDDEKRHDTYTRWFQRWQDTSEQNAFLGRTAYAPTLAQQTAWLQQRAKQSDDKISTAFNHISMMAGLMHALVLNTHIEYLQNPQVNQWAQGLLASIKNNENKTADILYQRFLNVLPNPSAQKILLDIVHHGEKLWALGGDLLGMAGSKLTVKGRISGAITNKLTECIPGFAKTLIFLLIAAVKFGVQMDAIDKVDWPKFFEQAVGGVKSLVNKLVEAGDNFHIGMMQLDNNINYTLAILRELFVHYAGDKVITQLWNESHTADIQQLVTLRGQIMLDETQYQLDANSPDDMGTHMTLNRDTQTLAADQAKYKEYQQLAHKLVPQSIQAGQELAALMLTVFTASEAGPTVAMGYKGASKASIQQLGSKYFFINGTPWLMHHSAMKIPDADVMKYLYQGGIMGAKDYKFGKYDLSQFQ